MIHTETLVIFFLLEPDGTTSDLCTFGGAVAFLLTLGLKFEMDRYLNLNTTTCILRYVVIKWENIYQLYNDHMYKFFNLCTLNE